MTINMVRTENNQWREQILCDVCHEPILEVNLAMVTWRENEAGVADVVVLHKGACDKLNMRNQLGHQPWTELSVFLAEYLANIHNEAEMGKFYANRVERAVR